MKYIPLSVSLLMLLASCGNDKTPATAAGGAPKNAAIPVNVFVVKSSSVENLLLSTGTLLPNEEVELRPETSGKITQISFTEGQRVSAGQVLIRTNDAELLAQVKKLRLQETLDKDKEQRLKKLLALNGISQEEYDIALTQYNSTRADLEYYQALLDKTVIKAPFNGIIGIRQVSVGSFISNTTPIATLLQTDPLKLEFTIPEKYLSSIRAGQEVNFEVEGRKGSYKAKITVIEPMVDQSTRSIRIRAIAPNPKGELVPGGFAKVNLGVDASNNAIMIPTEAVIPILKGKMVYISRNGKALDVKIETGFRNDSMVQVTNGLQPGDSVIVTGIMQMKKGISVAVKATR